jgi:hypothetical protein
MSISKFDETTKGQCLAAAVAAGTDKEIAAAAGVSLRTFRNWLTRYPEFKADIRAARSPVVQAGSVEKLQQRRAWAEAWLDNYLRTQGEILEKSITAVDEFGRETTEKSVRGKAPDLRLIDRVLGVSTEPEEFRLIISVAQPPDDDELEMA